MNYQTLFFHVLRRFDVQVSLFLLFFMLDERNECGVLVGIDERGLFNIPPHNDRLTTLIARFDQPFLDSTRPLPDLRRESIHDICALLSTFLRSLPAPLFHRSFFDAMWAWCVNPTLIREAENHKLFRRKNRKTDYGDLEAQIDNTSSSSSEDDAVEGFGGLPSFNSRRRKQRKKDREIEKARWKSYVLAHPEALEQHRSEKHEKRLRLERELYALETHQIAVSRLILLLLSQPSFSLLIYLLTFFNELLQHTQNNRLNYDKLGGMFGFKLLGGPSQGAAKIALCWLITRWGRIVEGFKSEDSRIACRRKLELEGKTEEEFSVPPVGRDSRFNVDPGENLRASKEQLPVSRAMTRKRSGSVTSSRRSSVSRSSSLSQEAREFNDRAVQEQKRRDSEPTSVRNCMLFDDAPRGRDSGSRSAEFEDTSILEPFGAEGSNGKAEKRYGEDSRVYGRKKRGVEDEHDSGVGRSDSGESGGGKGEHQRAAFSAIQHLLQSESGSDGEHASNPPYDPDNSSTYSEGEHISRFCSIVVDNCLLDYSDGGCRPLEIVPPVIPASSGRHMGEHTEGSDVVELKRELEIARRERDQAMKKLEKMRQAFEDAARI